MSRAHAGRWLTFLAAGVFLVPPANVHASRYGGRVTAPVLATSADDPALQRRLREQSPTVSPDEARAVARVAFETGRDLRQEWGVVWPPGLHNLLVNNGGKKGGLCFQWALGLVHRLEPLHLQTLTMHWAEAYYNTPSEHNVVVVTAKGQPFRQGILLDNWRYGGSLAWGMVAEDRAYEWKENPTQLAAALQEKPPRRDAATRARERR